jgi:hypothetical protein
VRLGLHILALLALLIQCLPLRTCAFQYMLSGSSCHDGEVTSEVEGHDGIDFAADGCAPHPVGSHDESCICEEPRMSANRMQHQVVSVDLLPAPVPGELLIDFRTIIGLAKTSLSVDSLPPSVGRSLPLLI